jgi:hypothetical protein
MVPTRRRNVIDWSRYTKILADHPQITVVALSEDYVSAIPHIFLTFVGRKLR